jgi:hypothetical protein
MCFIKKLNFIFFMSYINKVKYLPKIINMSNLTELQNRLDNYYRQLDKEYDLIKKDIILNCCKQLQMKISELRSNSRNNHGCGYYVPSTDYGVYTSVSYGPCTPSIVGLSWGSSGFYVH